MSRTMTDERSPNNADTSVNQARAEDYTARWPMPNLGVSDKTRRLLETYAKILPAEVEEHVRTLQAKASAVHPYPCIGSWRFIERGLVSHPLYHSEILPRMLEGDELYLDLACAIGQDIRCLVADGVDSAKTYGSDLRLDFLELGYEFFRDRETLKTKFIEADMFDANNALLPELDGKVSILHASAIFHLFTLEQQKQLALSVAKLLKPQKDRVIVGWQMGNLKPREYARHDAQGTRFLHNVESWSELWRDAGERFGVTFHVQTDFVEVGPAWRPLRLEEDEGAIRMMFTVRLMK